MTTELNSALSLIGIGPGDLRQLTHLAQDALQTAEVVIGYQVYIEQIRPLLDETRQEAIISPIGDELERAKQAVALAQAGRRVALLSSGDIGIYAMASPVFEILRQQGWRGNNPEVAVYPGVSAIQATAARLGAPLGHDFCTISLSDLLTPWPVIERRLQAAAWGDFVIAFYNPRSQKRDWQLPAALDILLAHRSPTTPVAIARNVTRPDEQISLTTLAEIDPRQVDMFTLVLIGNSQSYVLGERMVTPRGYEQKEGMNDSQPATFLPPQPPSEDVYPITLTKMRQMRAIVVGGGPVGERKVRGLLAAGVKVKVISPAVTPQLQAWAEAGQIEWWRQDFETGDLAGVHLVFAATNQRQVNNYVAKEAEARNQLCNVADQPEEGNFHVPAVHRRPEVLIAVSTAGESPVRARITRDEIAAWLEQK
jgi:cobalt-precorrin 5A hydrolase/precorrin-3B C17-methyltransferase